MVPPDPDPKGLARLVPATVCCLVAGQQWQEATRRAPPTWLWARGWGLALQLKGATGPLPLLPHCHPYPRLLVRPPGATPPSSGVASRLCTSTCRMRPCSAPPHYCAFWPRPTRSVTTARPSP